MERRSFFERYRPTNLSVDPLPLKVLNHTIWEAEMLGHVLDWASQYLHQKSCPSYLISPLLGKILEEVSKADLSECYSKQTAASMVLDADEVDADVVHNVSYQPLKLMQSVTSKVDDICLRYKEENDHIETDFPIESADGDISHIFGASYFSIKNSRRTLEDRMVILPEINKVFNLKSSANYFAVFDGHNGVEAAAYSAAHLHRHLFTSPDFPSDYSAAINYAFETTDTALLMKCKDENIRSGTTAVVALIVPGNIYIAWVGDSQAVLVRNTEPINLVSSHKPDREDELRRIKSAGGEVISIGGTWRVNGNLAVSRAIGNLDYKEYVTSTPEISQIETNGSEEFLILACDGLWDVVSPQRCVEVIRNSLLSKNPSDIDSVSQKLVIEAKQSGSGDNITVIVVLLKSKDDLIKSYSKEVTEKMNGSVEAPVTPTKPAAVPKSPSTTNSVASKVTSPSSPNKGSAVSKTTGTVTRSPLGLRNPPVSKTPIKSTEKRPPAKAPVPITKPGVAAPKTVKDGVASSAKPAPSKTTVGATSRTQLASKTAATTKKPLKTEETEKPVTTKSVVPPRPRPGTVPLSSRLTTTTKTAPKNETNKPGDSSAPTVKESTVTKRSVLNSARSTVSKEGNASSRVTQVRQPPAASTKPRVPSATTTTARPASGIQAAKPATSSTTATKKTVTSTTTTAATRPPIKKPLGTGPVKKEVGKVNGQPPVASKVDKKIAPIRSKAQEAAAAAAGKINGAATAGEIAAAKVMPSETSPQVNGVEYAKGEKQVELGILDGGEINNSVEAPVVAEKAKVEESPVITDLVVKEELAIVDTNENTLNLDAQLSKTEVGAETHEILQKEAEAPTTEVIENEINILNAVATKEQEPPVTVEVKSSEEGNIIDAFEVSSIDVSNKTEEREVEMVTSSIEATGNEESNNIVGALQDETVRSEDEASVIPVVNDVSATSEISQENTESVVSVLDTVTENLEVSGQAEEEKIAVIEPETVTKTDEETEEEVKVEETGEVNVSEDNSKLISNEFQNNVFNGEFTGYVENFNVTKSPEVAENEFEAAPAELALESELSDLLTPVPSDILEDEIKESKLELLAEAPEPQEISHVVEEIEPQPDIRSSSADLPLSQVDIDDDDQRFLCEEGILPVEGVSSEEVLVFTEQDEELIATVTASRTEDTESDSAVTEGQQSVVNDAQLSAFVTDQHSEVNEEKCLVDEEHQSALIEEQSTPVDEQQSALVAEQKSELFGEQQSELVGEQQSAHNDEQQSALNDEQQSALIDEQQSALNDEQQSALNDEQQSALVGEQQITHVDEQQSEQVEDNKRELIDEQQSAVVEDRQSGIVEDQQSGIVEDQQFGIVEDQQSGIVEDQLSGIVEDQLSGIVEDQQSGILEDKLSRFTEDQPFGLVDDQQSDIVEDQQAGLVDAKLSGLVEDQQSGLVDEQQFTLIEDEQPAIIEDINFNYEQRSQGKVTTLENPELIDDRSSPFEDIRSSNENLLDSNQSAENIYVLDEQSSIPTSKIDEQEVEALNLSAQNVFSDASFVSAIADNTNDDSFNQSGYPEEIESNVDEEPEELETGVTVDSSENQRITEEQAEHNASCQSFENIDTEYGQNFLNESQQPLLDCSTAESTAESELMLNEEESNAIVSKGETLMEDVNADFAAKSPNQELHILGEVEETKLEPIDPSIWPTKEVPLNPLVSENEEIIETSEPGVMHNNPFMESREGQYSSDTRIGGSAFHLDVNAPEFTPSGFNFDATAFSPSQGYQDVQGLTPMDDLAEFNKTFGTVNLQDQRSVNDIFGTNGSHTKELDLPNLPLDSANPFLNDTPYAVNGDKLSGIKNELGLGSQLPSGFQDPLLDINSTSPVPISELPQSSEVTNQGTRVDTMGSEAKDDFAIFNH
ncbi:unnamed protein product [Allacma fusca]|uniref:PPM-type phosphatase domain-containing protein n=1 Tax=Allacma fusca TaxID=39272 RepID=A0A8J2PH34_9HEXA|nr:unnamed protein product [Allacma fusca]